ncbi:aspartate ammonia-lyase [Candidatus Micrarchaeota archaeon]|nr:aspartate ammonia-lyase [Candidatus Micrarchaeota archaeon]
MRIEEDFIGKVEVKEDAYFGSFTTRAQKTFQISPYKVHKEITYAVATIKKCAAITNSELGVLEPRIAKAIVSAANEVISGKHDDQFVLDAYQAGAGTPLHMNVNEVIANRAEEILGGKKGQYKIVHPNNHINLAQSSNDVVPTSIRIASNLSCHKLLKEAKEIQKTLSEKGKKYRATIKIGRTHLQDAVPMTYGQTFDAWARAVEKDIIAIEEALLHISELGIGGTATGTSITAHPKFAQKIVAQISKETKVAFIAAENKVETTQNMNDFLPLSSALRQYATTLNRMADDLRLLVSGPKGGIAEVILPEIEPGSSIMPGKINPSVPEAVNMVCWRVMANDLTVSLAVSSGQLELNFGTPIIGFSLLESISLLTNTTRVFEGECIAGLEVDEKRAKTNFDNSLCYATAFNPYLGYSLVSKLVRSALKEGVSLKELIVKDGHLSKSEVENIIESSIGPSANDRKK